MALPLYILPPDPYTSRFPFISSLFTPSRRNRRSRSSPNLRYHHCHHYHDHGEGGRSMWSRESLCLRPSEHF
uniref:Xyloglucan galactosyltransferase n=1 Tax=Rhizophora mucronata TaxID=61149 RepID=A0A2P2QWE1_RHIMU